MGKELFISVIIPVYNVEKYLKECVDSILNQTHKNYEVILVDDGSSDNCGKLCDDYALKDSRIKVVHKENGGVADARNKGVDNAAYDFVCFVDGDDCIHPQTLEILAAGIEKYGVDISACLNLQSQEMPEDFYENKEVEPACIDVTEEEMLGDGPLSYKDSSTAWIATSKIIKKDIVKRFPMSVGKYYEDNAVAMRWLYEAKKIAFVDSELYFYRQVPGSIMHKALTHKSADYLWALEEQMKFAKTVGYSKLLEIIYENYLSNAIYFAKCFKDENKDYKFSRQILIYAKNIDKKYSLKISSKKAAEYKQKIFYSLHPPLKFIRKKFVHFLSLFKR